MTDLTSRNFGLLIAYLIPGFLILLSLQNRSVLIAAWLRGPLTDAPTVGGFLFVTVAAVAAGMTASVVRWLVLDTLHHLMGIKPPKWDFAMLPRNLAAFEATVDSHYRYYQAYANLLVATIIAALFHPHFPNELGFSPTFGYLLFLVLVLMLFVASRDTLKKYYDRTDAILKSSQLENSDDKRLA